MKDDMKVAIAYIAGTLITSKKASAIYDYQRRMHVMFSGTATESKVNVFDYNRSSHISGSGTKNKLSLYHYGEASHIDLSINGNSFKGFDYQAGHHFSGTVSGNNISIYDYGISGFSNFSI